MLTRVHARIQSSMFEMYSTVSSIFECISETIVCDCWITFKLTVTLQYIIIIGMGFTDREIVALLGAHALGRCHTDRSGYWGPWTFAENTFSNEYFRLLVEERWSPKMSHNGKPW